jgi:hypothetical protein
MQRHSNIQSPYDPYSGTQLCYTRYTGLRSWEFNATRGMNRTEIRRAKLFGALMVVGFIALGVLEALA